MTSGTLWWLITVSFSESPRPSFPSYTLGPKHCSCVLGTCPAPLALDLSLDLWPALGTPWVPALLWDPELLAGPERQKSQSTMVPTTSLVLHLNAPELITWAHELWNTLPRRFLSVCTHKSSVSTRNPENNLDLSWV